MSFENVRGLKILVTGGTGSFGRTVAAELLSQGAAEVRILSRDEAKQENMRRDFRREELKFHLGDVRNRDSVDNAMRGVDLVFHAAALKQVPSCEFFPMEAVRTNVVGSQNVINAAVDHEVRRVVCLSTDKAVMPINAMGLSKAMMEKIVQAHSRQNGHGQTTVCCVRYGNVMFSRGSVIPVFIRQIQDGAPITITEPRMTRFMLSLNDAVELVNFALLKGNSGDIFVKKAPACTVETLARTMLAMFSANNELRVIGMRHGEKLHETLATAEELSRAEDLGAYLRLQLDNRGLDYDKYFGEGNVEEVRFEDYSSANTEQLDTEQLRKLLLRVTEVRAELGTPDP